MADADVERFIISLDVLSLLATLFSNGLLLRAFHKVSSLRTPANLLLMNLALVDLLFIASFVLDVATFYVEEPFRLTSIHGKLFRTLNVVVLLNLAVVSIERLLVLKFSLRYPQLVTKRRVQIAIAIIWILGIVINVLPFLVKIALKSGKDDGRDFEDLLASHWKAGKFRCGVNRTNKGQKLGRRRITFFCINMLMLFLPYIVTIVCHAWVFKISRQHYKRVRAQLESVCPEMNLQMKHAKTTAIVLGSFVLLFTPMFLLATAKFFKGKRVCDPFPHKILKILFSQSAWLNPLIYAWKNKDFRKAFCEILKPLFSRLCCGRSEDKSGANPRVQNGEQT